MIWLKNFLEVLSAIFSIWEAVADRVGQLIEELWSAFPNPLSMFRAWLRFSTGLLGIVLDKVATFYWDLAAVGYEKKDDSFSETIRLGGKPWQHVMRPSDSIKWQGAAIGSMIKFLTQTGENDIIQWMIQRFGMFLWGVFKRITIIRKVIGWKTAADVIKFVKGVFESRKFNFILAAAFALFYLFLWTCVSVTGLMLFTGVGLAEPRLWEKYVLFSKHKRQKQTLRISRRIGGVKP